MGILNVFDQRNLTGRGGGEQERARKQNCDKALIQALFSSLWGYWSKSSCWFSTPQGIIQQYHFLETKLKRVTDFLKILIYLVPFTPESYIVSKFYPKKSPSAIHTIANNLWQSSTGKMRGKWKEASYWFCFSSVLFPEVEVLFFANFPRG